jgi:arginase
MHTCPSTEVRNNPAGVAAAALAHLQRRVDRIILHFDVDVIDSTELPLADFPHFNSGLSVENAITCLRVFLASPMLAGVVITEINPDHDPDGVLIPDFVRHLANAVSQH